MYPYNGNKTQQTIKKTQVIKFTKILHKLINTEGIHDALETSDGTHARTPGRCAAPTWDAGGRRTLKLEASEPRVLHGGALSTAGTKASGCGEPRRIPDVCVCV